MAVLVEQVTQRFEVEGAPQGVEVRQAPVPEPGGEGVHRGDAGTPEGASCWWPGHPEGRHPGCRDQVAVRHEDRGGDAAGLGGDETAQHQHAGDQHIAAVGVERLGDFAGVEGCGPGGDAVEEQLDDLRSGHSGVVEGIGVVGTGSVRNLAPGPERRSGRFHGGLQRRSGEHRDGVTARDQATHHGQLGGHAPSRVPDGDETSHGGMPFSVSCPRRRRVSPSSGRAVVVSASAPRTRRSITRVVSASDVCRSRRSTFQR